jgi:hypothetical protein
MIGRAIQKFKGKGIDRQTAWWSHKLNFIFLKKKSRLRRRQRRPPAVYKHNKGCIFKAIATN